MHNPEELDGGTGSCSVYGRMRGLQTELSILQCKATELGSWKQSLIDLIERSVLPQSEMLSQALAARGMQETESQTAAHHNAVQLLSRWRSRATDGKVPPLRSTIYDDHQSPTALGDPLEGNCKENCAETPYRRQSATRGSDHNSGAVVVQRLNLENHQGQVVESQPYYINYCGNASRSTAPPPQHHGLDSGAAGFIREHIVNKMNTHDSRTNGGMSYNDTGGINTNGTVNNNNNMMRIEPPSSSRSHSGYRCSPQRWTTGSNTNNANNTIISSDGTAVMCGSHTHRQHMKNSHINLMNTTVDATMMRHVLSNQEVYDTGTRGHETYILPNSTRSQLSLVNNNNCNINAQMSVRSNVTANASRSNPAKLSSTVMLPRALQPYSTSSTATTLVPQHNNMSQQYNSSTLRLQSGSNVSTTDSISKVVTDGCEFKDLDEDTFMAVPGIVRRRAKLKDVNEVYSFIWDYSRRLIEKEVLFKGNSERKRATNLGITLKDTKWAPKMSTLSQLVVIPRTTFIKNGISVVGQTGEARIMTLRHLRFIELLGREGSVRLSSPLLSGLAGSIIAAGISNYNTCSPPPRLLR